MMHPITHIAPTYSKVKLTGMRHWSIRGVLRAAYRLVGAGPEP